MLNIVLWTRYINPICYFMMSQNLSSKSINPYRYLTVIIVPRILLDAQSSLQQMP